MTITKDEAIELVAKRRSGRIFTVKFVKRANGEARVMNCRKGVKAHLQGGDLKYNPAKKNLQVVFDMHKKAYRMVNLETITAINADGVQYQVA
jgi:hypothetical protein